MTKHYQLMKHTVGEEEYFSIHEYYEFETVPGVVGGFSWTKDHFAVADSPEEMVEILQLMIKDIEKHGVKDFGEEAL
jgi:hypothetical protein